jgi:hypothetical protein
MPDGGIPPDNVAESLAQHAATQQSDLARDQVIGKRVLLGQRLWFLVVVPACLIVTAFLRGVHPLWPYPAVVWATGPLAALLGLAICRRPNRQPYGQMPGPFARRLKIQVPPVTYTSQTIAHVTSVISIIILILSGIWLGLYSGAPAGSTDAKDVPELWHALFGVLPALILSGTVYIAVFRFKRQREGHAGAG